MPITKDFLSSRITDYIRDVISKAPEWHLLEDLEVSARFNYNNGTYEIKYDEDGEILIRNINVKNFNLALKRMICEKFGENPLDF